MHTVVYYRESDGRVMDTVTAPNPPSLDAGHGPGILALRVDSAEIIPGTIRRIVGGVLTHETDPDYLDRQNKKKLVADKVKQKLNLTDEEFKTLFGG